jgi:hypothetical protein
MVKLTLIKYILFIGIVSVVFDACISQGTLLDRDKILRKPYKTWTEDECRIVMETYASTNILDRAASMSIVVIPCTPNFLLAYNCLKWKKHLCSFEEFEENTDRQARNCFGGSFDEQTGKFINGNGEYVQDIRQFDSLLITIDIENGSDFKNLTALISVKKMQWWVGSSSFYDLFPDITGMEEKISFRAGDSVLARPEYIRSSDATYLVKEEQYAAMFHIDSKFKQFIREHESVDLYVSLGKGNHDVVIPVRFSP